MRHIKPKANRRISINTKKIYATSVRTMKKINKTGKKMLPPLKNGLEEIGSSVYSSAKKAEPKIKHGLEQAESAVYLGVKKATPVIKTSANSAYNSLSQAFTRSKKMLMRKKTKSKTKHRK
jgi:hypothetical protein